MNVFNDILLKLIVAKDHLCLNTINVAVLNLITSYTYTSVIRCYSQIPFAGTEDSIVETMHVDLQITT